MLSYDLLSRREREELWGVADPICCEIDGCAYCAARPALGEPAEGEEPQCLFCWDTGIELTDSERERRISALPANALVRIA